MPEQGAAAPQAPELLDTGVPNLDLVLGGGIPRGSIVMVIGAPGTGKTMLAQQVAFHLAARGQATVYLTGYSETHAKPLLHTRGLGFFREELLGQQIQLISLAELLEVGPTEAEEAIIATVREQRAGLVVLDGFRTMRRYLADDLLIGHFLYSLGAKLMLRGATTLVTTEGEPESPTRYPELTVCDVIVGLYRERRGGRHRRLLDVMKARGAAALDGVHPFSIDRRGLTVRPPGVARLGFASGPDQRAGRLRHRGRRRPARRRTDRRVDDGRGRQPRGGQDAARDPLRGRGAPPR